MDFKNAKELLALCQEKKLPISEVMRQREILLGETTAEIVDQRMDRVLEIMKDAAFSPIKDPVISMGGLIGGEARKLCEFHDLGKSLCGNVLGKGITYAMATLETNASMGLIVASPTAGSAGIVPGLLLALQETYNLSDEQINEGFTPKTPETMNMTEVILDDAFVETERTNYKKPRRSKSETGLFETIDLATEEKIFSSEKVQPSFEADIKPAAIPERLLLRALKMLTEQNDRLGKMVKTLLDMSELQTVGRDEKIILNDLVDEVLEDLEPLAQEKNIKLIGSDILIYRLVYNLVENAIKYNHSDGQVTVNAYKKQKHIYLSVEDTGSGIPKELRERVFEPFFRVDKSRSRELGGVGLGLALVHEIVRVHDGSISIKSNPAGGTIFEVIFDQKSKE